MRYADTANNALKLALFIFRAQQTDIRVDPAGWLHQATWSQDAEDLRLAERGYVNLLRDDSGAPIAVKGTKKLDSFRGRFAIHICRNLFAA